MKPSIRLGAKSDAAFLAGFAARTFQETFGSDNAESDMALHLAHAFGEAQMARELDDAAITTLLMERDGATAGYAQVRAGIVPDCVRGDDPVELWRFYIDKPWHGTGLAQSLMAAVLEVARGRGARTLWLGVWERNARARTYYAKEGFSDVGAHVFMLGTDAQTDRILVKSL